MGYYRVNYEPSVWSALSSKFDKLPTLRNNTFTKQCINPNSMGGGEKIGNAAENLVKSARVHTKITLF